MRYGVTSDIQSTIAAGSIITGIAARLEFQSETIFVWTGSTPIQPTGSGDSLLDGNRFEPMARGIVLDIGENAFTMTGSNEFQISLAIPADASTAVSASQVHASEYQSRPATIWRVFLYPQSNPLAAPIWMFRRIRSGAMDKVEIQNDGMSHRFNLTIESHQAAISNATNQTYLDQTKYDPNDTSQKFAASIANGDPAPMKGAPNSLGGYAGGAIDGSYGGLFNARTLEF